MIYKNEIIKNLKEKIITYISEYKLVGTVNTHKWDH